MLFGNRRELFYRIIFCFIGYCIGLFWQAKLQLNVDHNYSTQLICNCDKKDSDNADLLLKALKLIARGFKYIKSNKARIHLREAFIILNSLFKYQINVRMNETVNRERDVCPEYWIDMYHGYPYYFTGFEIENCTNAPPFSSLVSILIDSVYNTDAKDLKQIIRGVSITYPNISVILSTVGIEENYENLKNELSTLTFKIFENNETEGEIWKKLVESASTKYVLIGKKLSHFTQDSRLERLVRVLDNTNADAVGGSHRNETGHYSLGCYQTSMRNYAFKIVEGYDLSYNSCIYCNYISGPFIIKTGKFLDHFDERLNGEIAFINMFEKIGNDSENVNMLVCPDAMYFTKTIGPIETSEKDWLAFANIWELNIIILPDGGSYSFTCNEVNADCGWNTGLALPICCLKELINLVENVMETCSKFGIRCEIEGGTVLGSLKFNGILPWERDSDINWHCKDYVKMLETEDYFDAMGYSLSNPSAETDIVAECDRVVVNSSVNCGYFDLMSKHFRTQMYGAKYLAQSYLESLGIVIPTRTLMNGVWVITYPNPALYARNLYGDDIFEHVEHWLDLGYPSGWKPYKTGNFTECPRKNFHGCLDQFLPSGNLQFMDVWL